MYYKIAIGKTNIIKPVFESHDAFDIFSFATFYVAFHKNENFMQQWVMPQLSIHVDIGNRFIAFRNNKLTVR